MTAVEKKSHPSRSVWLAVLISAIVVLIRSALIANVHNEYWDDQYHYARGLAVLTHEELGAPYNDPPLGEWVESLPLYVMGIRLHGPQDFGGNVIAQHNNILYGQSVLPESSIMAVAIWKSLLFLPACAIVFIWMRRLYDERAAWLALALVLCEPTIAAHILTGALDVFGMEAILIACFATDCYLRRPTLCRLIFAGIACAAAMLTKHTGLITPAIIVTMLWFDPHRTMKGASTKFRAILIGAAIAILAIWPLTLFDMTIPAHASTKPLAPLASIWNSHVPAGIYLAAFADGVAHVSGGHAAFLYGQIRDDGFWSYYAVVAAYKVPIGVALIVLLAIASIKFVPARRAESSLFIPALAWTIFLVVTRLNIGFRHFLPPYLFWLLLSARVALMGKRLREIAWLGVAAAAIHAFTFQPDYLSYINFPRDKPWLAIGDSNVDWGQSIRQIRNWIDAHHPRQPIYVRAFTDPKSLVTRYYLGRSVHMLYRDDPIPTSGTLIISMVRLEGVYEPWIPYRAFWPIEPDAIIGHSTLVYDLDRFNDLDRHRKSVKSADSNEYQQPQSPQR